MQSMQGRGGEKAFKAVLLERFPPGGKRGTSGVYHKAFMD